MQEGFGGKEETVVRMRNTKRENGYQYVKGCKGKTSMLLDYKVITNQLVFVAM